MDLTEADVVVSGGRGMGGSDYTVIEKLADAPSGAVGNLFELVPAITSEIFRLK